MLKKNSENITTTAITKFSFIRLQKKISKIRLRLKTRLNPALEIISKVSSGLARFSRT